MILVCILMGKVRLREKKHNQIQEFSKLLANYRIVRKLQNSLNLTTWSIFSKFIRMICFAVKIFYFKDLYLLYGW